MLAPLHHIAIIMDGNRRWAKEQGFPSSYGHLKGVESVKSTIKYCLDKKIPYLSLFAFSTENWKRPSIEVKSIFSLMETSIHKYVDEFLKYGIRVRTLGHLEDLPEKLQSVFRKIEDATKDNQALNLVIVVNYGGRKEILQAMSKWITEEIKEPLTEENFEKHLPSHYLPDPDLLIRTGGVRRLSNFYLWSSAYSELYFSNLMWPEFDSKELDKAIEYYTQTSRRFGGG